MDRRGQAEMLEWFPRMMLLIVAVIVVVVMVNYYANREVTADSVERSARAYRLFYDGGIIMYTDPATQRVYPGVVDLQRFTDANIAKTFAGRSASTGRAYVVSCLTLSRNDKSSPPIAVCDDKDAFNEYSAIAQSGMLGSSSATLSNLTFAVTIADGKTMVPGTLNIAVARRNS